MKRFALQQRPYGRKGYDNKIISTNTITIKEVDEIVYVYAKNSPNCGKIKKYKKFF